MSVPLGRERRIVATVRLSVAQGTLQTEVCTKALTRSVPRCRQKRNVPKVPTRATLQVEDGQRKRS